MAFEAEKQQAALIPSGPVRLGVQEVVPSYSQGRVWLTSGLASRTLIRYQLGPGMACNLVSSFWLVAFLGTTSRLRLRDRDGCSS